MSGRQSEVKVRNCTEMSVARNTNLGISKQITECRKVGETKESSNSKEKREQSMKCLETSLFNGQRKRSQRKSDYRGGQ